MFKILLSKTRKRENSHAHILYYCFKTCKTNIKINVSSFNQL